MPATQRAVLVQAVLFVLGFSIVFVLLGIGAGLLGGGGVFALPGLREVAGIAIIALGIATMLARGPFATMGGMHIDVNRPAGRSRGTLDRSRRAGGRRLDAVHRRRARRDPHPRRLAAQVGAATLLLVAYSAGLAVPSSLAAVALPRLRPLVDLPAATPPGRRARGGPFIVVIGVMILTNTFARLAAFFPIL